MRRSVAVSGLMLLLALIAVPAGVPLAQAQPSPPASLHKDGGITGPIVESADAIKVTGIIQCWCGGCQNQTLHDCTCSLAAAERAKVAAALAEGRTPDELIATYVAEHGAQVRIVPERRGLDLIGWAVPFAAAVGSLLALGMVLVAWRRRGAVVAAGGKIGAMAASDRIYRERLERDLRETE